MNFKIQKYSQNYLFNSADDLEEGNPEPIPASELAVETVSPSPDVDFLANIKAQVGVDRPATLWDPKNEDLVVDEEEPLAGFTNTTHYVESDEAIELGSAGQGDLFVTENQVFVFQNYDWEEVRSQEELDSVATENTSEL